MAHFQNSETGEVMANQSVWVCDGKAKTKIWDACFRRSNAYIMSCDECIRIDKISIRG